MTASTKSKKRVKAYYKARELEGKTQEASKQIAGYSPTYSPTEIENSKGYLELEEKFGLKQHFQKAISQAEVAGKLAENIRSEEGSTSNTAIKIYADKVEPQGQENSEADEVVIIFKKESKDEQGNKTMQEVRVTNPKSIKPQAE